MTTITSAKRISRTGYEIQTDNGKTFTFDSHCGECLFVSQRNILNLVGYKLHSISLHGLKSGIVHLYCDWRNVKDDFPYSLILFFVHIEYEKDGEILVHELFPKNGHDFILYPQARIKKESNNINIFLV